MKGLMYKELKQNSVFIVLTIVVAVVAMILPLFFTSVLEKCSPINVFKKMDESQVIKIIWPAFIVIGYFIVGIIQGMVFRDDNKKAWYIFIVSSPEGVSGYLQVKYELVLAMCILMHICCCICNSLLGFISVLTSGEAFSFMFILEILLYVQIIIRSIETIFTVRFGYKLGNFIKLILMVLLTTVLSLIVIFNPANIFQSILHYFFEKGSESLTSTFLFILSLLPVASLLLFYFSYKLSCIFYAKGAEQYAK